jgi:hypothetical protein
MLFLYLFSTIGRKPLEAKLRRPTDSGVDGLQDSLCRAPYNAKRNAQTVMAV